ncbi:hypothetical protein D3C71_1175880 [compost metagenome]
MGIPLLSCLAIPGSGLLEVLCYPLAAVIHQSQVVLRPGIPLLSGLAVPGKRLLEVLRHLFAGGIHQAQVKLRLGITLLSQSDNIACRGLHAGFLLLVCCRLRLPIGATGYQQHRQQRCQHRFFHPWIPPC